MRNPIRVQIVEPQVRDSIWQKVAGLARIAISVVKDVGAISAVLVAVISFYPSGKAFIVSLFSLGEVEQPSLSQIIPQPIPQSDSAPFSSGDLSPIGWSYLGNASDPEGWYYPDLDGVLQADWPGMVVKPTTTIYLRSEPVSAVNPNPVALAVIGNNEEYDECLRIADYRRSNTGSIWLNGALVRCL